MVSTYTTNTHLELQGTGDNVDTWGAELNANALTIIDDVLGNVQTISLSGSDVTLTTTQTQVATIVLTGTLTANVNVIFPAIGRVYQVVNSTLGAFTANFQIGSPAAGLATAVPQGAPQTIILDGTNVYLSAAGRITGEITTFPFNSIPPGWLECNGAAVSRTAYPALNNLAARVSYGAPWGSGNGSTTFNVPDLRGYFVRGWSDGSSIDSGRVFGSTQTSDNLSHTHTVTDPGHNHTLTLTSGGGNAYTPSGTPARWSNDAALGAAPTGTTTTVTTGISLVSSGSTEARPYNVALMYAIKT